MAVIPTGGWAEVTLEDVRLQGQTQSPYTGKRKVYLHPGPTRYLLKLRTRPFKEGSAEATAWVAFFDALNGLEGTFSLDASRYLPGRAGVSALTFRLTKPQTGPFGFGRSRFFTFELEALSE